MVSQCAHDANGETVSGKKSDRVSKKEKGCPLLKLKAVTITLKPTTKKNMSKSSSHQRSNSGTTTSTASTTASGKKSPPLLPPITPPSFLIPSPMSNCRPSPCMSFGTVCSSSVQSFNSNPTSSPTASSKRTLPTIFLLIENLSWKRAEEHARANPQETKDWSTVRTRSSSSKVSKTKRLAIHHACLKLRSSKREGALSTIEALLEMNPSGAAQRESRHGCLPLHLAAFASSARRDTTNRLPIARGTRIPDDVEGEAERSCLVGVTRALLKAYPKAVKIGSEGGRLPLHMACSGRACAGVVEEILLAYPSAARHRTGDGSLPLHLAASWGVSSPRVAVALLRAYPDAAFGLNPQSRTPLEEALYVAGENGRAHQCELVRALRKHPTFWNRPSLGIMELTLPDTPISRLKKQVESHEDPKPRTNHFTDLDDDPGDDTVTKSEHEYPLLNAPTDTKSQISHVPSISSSTVNTRTTELAGLINSRRWSSVLHRNTSRPYEASEWLTVTSVTGRTTRFTPLHFACERAPPVQAVAKLIESYPKALSVYSMPGGQLPLHIACTWGSATHVISHILAMFSHGAHIRDEMGNLPIHSACYSGAEEGAVRCLLECNPKCIWATNRAGSTPLDIVRRLNHENQKEVTVLLKEYTNEKLRAEDALTKEVVDASVKEDLLWV